MAAKINWRRYGTKLRHCQPMYTSGGLRIDRQCPNRRYELRDCSIIANRHQRQSDLFALKLDLPVLAVPAVSEKKLFTVHSVAPRGFCNRGGSEVWVYRGSRVRSPPVLAVLAVYQRGSLLDGLAMYLSRDTKKFHDNESTHILHNFWTSTHRGEASPHPPGGVTA